MVGSQLVFLKDLEKKKIEDVRIVFKESRLNMLSPSLHLFKRILTIKGI